MNDERFAQLRSQASDLLRARKLPPAPQRIYPGTADGASSCAVCGVTIERGAALYEIAAAHNETRRTLHAHPDCHTAWRAETIRYQFARP